MKNFLKFIAYICLTILSIKLVASLRSVSDMVGLYSLLIIFNILWIINLNTTKNKNIDSIDKNFSILKLVGLLFIGGIYGLIIFSPYLSEFKNPIEYPFIWILYASFTLLLPYVFIFLKWEKVIIIIGIIISSISCFYGGFYLASHILGRGSPSDATGNGLTALMILILDVIFIFFHTCVLLTVNLQKSEKNI